MSIELIREIADGIVGASLRTAFEAGGTSPLEEAEQAFVRVTRRSFRGGNRDFERLFGLLIESLHDAARCVGTRRTDLLASARRDVEIVDAARALARLLLGNVAASWSDRFLALTALRMQAAADPHDRVLSYLDNDHFNVLVLDALHAATRPDALQIEHATDA